MIDKISGPDSSKPSERKEKKSSPDSKEFQDLMKTEKVREKEIEKKRKRKFQLKEGVGKEDDETAQAPSSSLPSPFQSYNQGKTSQKGDFDISQDDNVQSTSSKDKSDDKKKKKLKENEAQVGYVDEKEKAKILKNEKLKEEEKKIQNIKEKPVFEKESEKQKDKSKAPINKESSITLLDLPKEIASQVQQTTSTVTSYLHSDIVPLFEKMVGTIFVMQSSGVTTTEVYLTSQAFQSSILFGSVIQLQRYATAPDSFNITLRGSTQAVDLFNANLDGLYDAFKQGNFSFKIGRLETEYEKQIFKRKEKPTGKESDSGLG